MRLARNPRITRADPQRTRVGEPTFVDEPNAQHEPVDRAPATPSALDTPPTPEISDWDPESGLKHSLDEDQTEFFREVDADRNARDLNAPLDADHMSDAPFVPEDAEAELLLSPDDMDTEDDAGGADMSAMIGVMQTLGVDPICALKLATDVACRKPPPSLIEM